MPTSISTQPTFLKDYIKWQLRWYIIRIEIMLTFHTHTSWIHFCFNNAFKNAIQTYGEKNSQNWPSPLQNVDPIYLHPSLGQPHSPLQMATQCLMHFYTSTPQSLQWLQWDAPNLFNNLYPYVIHHPSNDPTHHRRWHPDPISHFSTIHPQDRDRQTNRQMG